MSNIEQAALATANWWADKVFGGAVGSDGSEDGLAMMLGIVSGAQGVPASASKRDEFVARLGAHVVSELNSTFAQRDGRSAWYAVTLSTDYGPEGVLARLAGSLEIGGSFPWKTMTWTYMDHFVTAFGCGASGELTWTADDYVRPKCGQGQWSDHKTEFHRLPWKCSAPKYHPVNAHVFDDPEPLCQAFDPRRDGRLCLKPESDEHHRKDVDYLASYAHEFQAES